MDIFVEHLVKKKRDAMDFVKIAACIFGFFIVLILILNIIPNIPFLGSFTLLFVAGAIYGVYLLITSVNLEYEYCFTNGLMDVDKIINVRRRKRMTDLNVRKIEIFANKNHRAFNRYLNDNSYKKVYACVDKTADSTYFIVYNENGINKMLLFTPNEKIIEGIKKYNPTASEVEI